MLYGFCLFTSLYSSGSVRTAGQTEHEARSGIPPVLCSRGSC